MLLAQRDNIPIVIASILLHVSADFSAVVAGFYGAKRDGLPAELLPVREPTSTFA